MAKTTNFGLNKFGQEGRISDEGYKFSLKDRDIIDTLLFTLYQHDHRAVNQFTFIGPQHEPTLTLNATGGTLPASTDLFYRISYRDNLGNETEGSISAFVRTIAPILPPDSASLATATTGGTLTPGTYKYALSYYQVNAQTRAPNIQTISIPTGTVTNTVTITLPLIEPDATGWKIYRKGPGDIEYWLLDTVVAGATPPIDYVDDGSLSPNCDKKRPTINDTNSTNSVTIDIDALDLPLDTNVTSWRVYRTTIASVYGTASLLETITETTTQGGADLITTATDAGASLQVGRPLDQTTIPPEIPTLDADDIWSSDSSRLSSSLAPLGVHLMNTFIAGKIVDSTVYNEWTPPHDMPVERIELFLQDAPDGNGTDYSTVRVKDDATQNEIQHVWNDSLIIPEIQSMSHAAGSGTFTLSFDGQGPTGSLDWDALASEIETELELLSNITDVTVTGSGTSTDPWFVQFDDPEDDVALLTSAGISLTHAEITPGFDGGTFTLTFQGQTTGTIDFDESAGDLETELELLSTITAVTVTGTGTEADPWLVEFVTPGAEDVEVMQGDNTNLGGNTLAISVFTEGFGNTVIDIDIQDTSATQVFQTATTDFDEVEAEDAVPGGGTSVSDAVATNDVAMELDAQNETSQWDIGTLEVGDYTAKFWVRDVDKTSDFDIAVVDQPSTDIIRTSITLHRATYEPAYELKFTSTGTEDFLFEVEKTDTGTDRVRVDKFEYRVSLPILHAGATCQVEGLHTLTPTDEGGDVQVNIWY